MPQDPNVLLEQNRGAREKTDEELPATTTISLDVVGERGKRYKHDFVYTVPNLGSQVDIARLKASFLPQGSLADPNGASLVEQVAYLAVTLDQKRLPKWWEPWSMYDATPISALYAEALDYERRFHGRAKENADRGEDEGVDQGRGYDEIGGEEETSSSLVEGVQAAAQRRKTLSSSRG